MGDKVVKKTLRTMTLAALGLAGTLSVAHAQPAPDGAPVPPAPAPAAPPAPPPPAPPPPAPPPVEFGVAPASLPSAPVGSSTPVPSVSWGATPGADTTTPVAPVEEKPQSKFYFTRFTWGNAVSASTVGVGQNYISPTPTYDQTFTLNLRYYVVNDPLDKVYVNVNAGVSVEVTDSANTTTTLQHEPLLNDIVVGAGYGHTVYQSADREWKTTLGVGASVVLPTSIVSQGQGKYLTPGVSLLIAQALPLAGARSDWFPDLLAFGSVGYSHIFSQCYTPCNATAASYPRQAGPANLADATGGGGATVVLPETSADDQLAAGSMAIDKVRLGLTYYLTIYKNLSLGNSWEIQAPFKHQFPATGTVVTPTGTVPLAGSVTAVNPVTTFDLSLSYVFFNTARVDLGYQNITPELVDNMGGRNSIFYTPGGSEFYGNVSLYIDSLIDRATGTPDPKKLARGRFGNAQ